MSDFVLEIGTEEIPARFLDDTQKELLNRFTTALTAEELPYKEIQTYASPRRATVYIKDLAPQQEVKEETFLGPAKKIAYNEDGSLSKAAQGFARGHKVNAEDIFLVETEKGTYIAVKKQVGGMSAKEVLEKICPQIIIALPFAKKMRWHTYSLAYARPIHSLLALLDAEILNFSVGEIHSSNKINGHRIHGVQEKEVPSAGDYFSSIEEQSILLNAEKRKEYIVEKGNTLAPQGKILWKDSLLDEVKGLVEFPLPLLADFDPSFLELPREVLLTSMESHQKSFGVEDKEGKLLPHFLTVLNLQPKDINIVKKGWERVLKARLEDARFFWNTDNAVINSAGFDTWLEKLEKVIFLGPLGSMGDKSRRIEKLAKHFAEKLNLNPELAGEAGRYAKADLVSSMVNEFDTLQGIMGGIYAQRIQKKEVGNAIRDHYLPAGPETEVPQNDYAALISLCDKTDTLVGLFGLNNIPSGTADPYALRRNALGVARILRDKNWSIDIQNLFEVAYSFYAENIKWKLSKEATLEKLLDFYHARVKNLFLTEGNDPLFVDAIMSAEHIYMASRANSLNTLIAFSKHANYITTVQSFKRITNIIRKQALNYTLTDNINVALFENASEKDLYAHTQNYLVAFDKAYEAQNFNICFELLTEISPLIDTFFDSSMIMAEDEAVRQNRLNLLATIQRPLTKIADFTALNI